LFGFSSRCRTEINIPSTPFILNCKAPEKMIYPLANKSRNASFNVDSFWKLLDTVGFRLSGLMLAAVSSEMLLFPEPYFFNNLRKPGILMVLFK
jgi:hypothetical protein